MVETARGEDRREPATEYLDLVLEMRRTSRVAVTVQVRSSPAGAMRAPARVRFPAAESAAIHASMAVGEAAGYLGAPGGSGAGGGAQIGVDEAAALGERLAAVLFPPPVSRLVAESVALAARRPGGGLRIRLLMEDSLVDLPWEYVQRPDRRTAGRLSSFLLLDHRISLVRQAADPRIAVRPISGRQRLAFVGTLWDGAEDGWGVGEEFRLLRQALAPVARYISPAYRSAHEPGAFGERNGEAAVFHYAGHCDLDADGRSYLLRLRPTRTELRPEHELYLDDLAKVLGRSTRLAVMSACNSGFWPMVAPLLDAGVPAVVGLNGSVASASTVQFCAKLYESLAVGLTLDEAVGRARLHVMEWGRGQGLFDWGLFMLYMPSPQAVLFPRRTTAAVLQRQMAVRQNHVRTIGATHRIAQELDGLDFGEIMSELSRRRVLILGRFTGRRLAVLERVKAHLARHPNGYIPELFTFRKPQGRDLTEAIVGFASLSRFIIADLSEPRSVQSELEAIVPHFQSVPVVPVLNRSGKEYATFESIRRRPNVAQPTLHYANAEDLVAKLDDAVVRRAEAMLSGAGEGPAAA